MRQRRSKLDRGMMSSGGLGSNRQSFSEEVQNTQGVQGEGVTFNTNQFINPNDIIEDEEDYDSEDQTEQGVIPQRKLN